MPAWDELAVRQEAGRLRLGLDPRQRREGAGMRLGAGPGASLEFHDHRNYQPGDDLRHLDWAASARTGSLILRRHRKEVLPRLEILVDGSASMAAHPGKLALATGLAALMATLALSRVSNGRFLVNQERMASSRQASPSKKPEAFIEGRLRPNPSAMENCNC